jgi:hypothetical protein
VRAVSEAMGCDGGTIPTRGELVKTKKKPEQISKDSELMTKWKHCALSQEPLKQPIVACQLGRLYNKESVLEFLLDKSNTEKKFAHIRGLRDVKELNLTDNPAFKPDDDAKAGAGQDPCGISPYVCSVTGLEMNGRFRFCYLLTCGCVFAERAILEVKDNRVCFLCGAPYKTEDIIPINGSEEELEQLKGKMEEKRLKVKKGKNGKSTKSCSVSCPNEDAGSLDADAPAVKRQKTEDIPSCSSASEPKITTVADAGTNDQLMKASSSSTAASSSNVNPPEGKKNKASDVAKLTKEISEKKLSSLQKDKKVSSVYKSLFNTHPTALNQPKAHWVTYNPQYN